MQFSYKLSEAEYLAAVNIRIAKTGRGAWERLSGYIYLIAPWIILWGALAGGMLFERSELIGVSVEIHRRPPIGDILTSSIAPSLVLYWLALVVFRFIFKRVVRNRRKEHFRSDPGCQLETAAEFTLDSVSFRCPQCSHFMSWSQYVGWAERNGILVLQTRGGIRQIVKTAGLDESQKAELLSILNASLRVA